jgi:hypothetical protein
VNRLHCKCFRKGLYVDSTPVQIGTLRGTATIARHDTEGLMKEDPLAGPQQFKWAVDHVTKCKQYVLEGDADALDQAILTIRRVADDTFSEDARRALGLWPPLEWPS